MGSLNYKEIMTGNFLHRGNWSVVKVVGTLPNDLIVVQGRENDIQFTENISNLEPVSLSMLIVFLALSSVASSYFVFTKAFFLYFNRVGYMGKDFSS